MKDEDYLVHNINKIAKELKHINWNLGTIVAVLKNNKKLFNEIEAEKKEDHTQ